MLPNCHLPVLSEDVSPETQLDSHKLFWGGLCCYVFSELNSFRYLFFNLGLSFWRAALRDKHFTPLYLISDV